MRNYIQAGEVIAAVAPAGGVKSGDGVLIGSIFGIAATDAIEAASVELATEGVYDLPAVGPIDAGAAAYWDGSAKKITATVTANTLVGAVLTAVGGGGTVARVRLNGAAGLTADASLAAALAALTLRVTALEGA